MTQAFIEPKWKMLGSQEIEAGNRNDGDRKFYWFDMLMHAHFYLSQLLVHINPYFVYYMVLIYIISLNAITTSLLF